MWILVSVVLFIMVTVVEVNTSIYSSFVKFEKFGVDSVLEMTF